MAPIAQQLPLQASTAAGCEGLLGAALQSSLGFSPAVSSGLQSSSPTGPGAQNSQSRLPRCCSVGSGGEWGQAICRYASAGNLWEGSSPVLRNVLVAGGAQKVSAIHVPPALSTATELLRSVLLMRQSHSRGCVQHGIAVAL